MKARVLTVGIVLAGMALGPAPSTQGSATRVVPTEVQPQPSPAERRGEVMRKGGGLKELAAVTGEFFVEIPGTEGGPATIRELVNAASLILVGRTVSNHSRLTPMGDMIHSACAFEVESVLKGEQHGSTVTVVLMGGRVVFEGGSVAEQRVAKTEQPAQHERYLLFLQRPRAPLKGDTGIYEPGELIPVFDTLGLYRLAHGGDRVEPADRRGRRLADEIATMRPAELIRAVQSIRGGQNRVGLKRSRDRVGPNSQEPPGSEPSRAASVRTVKSPVGPALRSRERLANQTAFAATRTRPA